MLTEDGKHLYVSYDEYHNLIEKLAIKIHQSDWKFDIARFITTPKGEIAGKVLLVDDLADSGHTLNAVIHQLKTNYKPITELRSAVIWTKGMSTFQPDYSVELLPTNPWIHQPFEGYDSLSPEQLMAKWKI
jgi:hypoxanthine phosphoribosyltransferase